MSAPRSAAEWAAMLKTNWEKRARSPSRDFYVASHPGWRDDERWRAQAETDAALMLTGLDPDGVARSDLLEIGCGVGRLARPFARVARTYTGVDIAPGMVEEARQRGADLDNARFFVGDGTAIPAEARDRRYQLAVCLAVFIHCPRDVIAAIVGDTFELLAPGGQLRFSVRGDLHDPTGIEAPAAVSDQAHEQMQEIVEQVATGEEMALIDGHYYMGDTFRYDDLTPFLAGSCSGAADVVLRRFDLANIYGWIERRA